MLPSTPLSTFSSTLPGMLSSTLPIALYGTLPACWTLCSQVCSQHTLNHTPEHALKYTPNCTWWHAPSLLDCTLPSNLSKRSQSHSQLHSMAHSQPAWLYAPKYALQTLWITFSSTHSSTLPIALDNTPSLPGSTLPSTPSRGKTPPISLDYMLPCLLLYTWSRDLLSCRC